jgi:hypoxanthine phosphoribosyltransferase
MSSLRKKNMPAKINFEGDKAQYIAPSWDELDKTTFQVAKKILESGEDFDLIVALAKGSWPMSRSFIDFLGKNDLASLGVRFYSGINETFDEPIVYQDLPFEVKKDLKGKKVLVFDDVADSGKSLSFAIDYLTESGASIVKTATIYSKPRTSLVPDFYGEETDAWIIFPFEVREMTALLSQTWLEQGISREEIKQRFLKFGFDEEIISYSLEGLANV